MNVLVCGSCMPEQFEYEVKDLAAASNQYHLNMIKALKAFAQVQVLSYIGMNLNGTSKDKIAKECKREGIDCVFKDKNPIKTFLNYQKELKEKLKWADIVITYNVQYVWFGIGNLAKKNNVKSILVWADHTPVVERRGVAGKIYAYLSQITAKKYTKAVLLSQNLSNYLSINQEIEIVHGCVDLSQFQSMDKPIQKDPMIFMYSGLLAPVTGVDIYLEAIKKVKNKNIKFVITGKGPINVERAAQGDERIIYKGFVSREEYLNLIQASNVLVNPRNMNLLENKNNFPSKVIEYIASGRVLLSTRFPGYHAFSSSCRFVDSSPEALASGIEQTIKTYETEYKRTHADNVNFSKKFAWEEEIKRFL
jgi:glycosyltransferase involved in cell wall biosynthesis